MKLELNHSSIPVLGSEYCSGYEDAVGKWNSGFYCPASDESQEWSNLISHTHAHNASVTCIAPLV